MTTRRGEHAMLQAHNGDRVQQTVEASTVVDFDAGTAPHPTTRSRCGRDAHDALKIVMLITMGIERPSGMRYFFVARELVRRGHQVRILALHPDLATCPQRRFVRDGVEVWYVGQMHARKDGNQPERFTPLRLLWTLILSTLGMLGGIVRSPADVYHLGKPQPINGVAALLGVWLLRGQRFYVDCDDDEAHSNRFSAGWQQVVFAFWQWLLPRMAAGVTVNTMCTAQRLHCQRIAPIVYVPNGVADEHFCCPPPALVAAMRQSLGLDGRRVIAYVGTLALHNHPVDLLLTAFAQLAADYPDTVLLLIGGGEDRATLRAQAAALGLTERVLFTGHVPHPSVPLYLALALASVDPVHDNAVARARSPLKLFESAALGVPVITGKVGDRAAILDNGQVGILVRPGDATALARGIRVLLDDPARHAALAQAGRQAMREHATWRILAGRWEAVYDKQNSTTNCG